LKGLYEFYVDGNRYIESKLKNMLVQEVTYIEREYVSEFRDILVGRYPRYLSIDGAGMYSPKLALNHYVETNFNTEQTLRLMHRFADDIGIELYVPNERMISCFARTVNRLRRELKRGISKRDYVKMVEWIIENDYDFPFNFSVWELPRLMEYVSRVRELMKDE